MRMREDHPRPDPLPGPFAAQDGPEMATPAAVEALAAGQVKALLELAPAFYQLSPVVRERMSDDLRKISTYTATLLHDDWSQSRKLDQTPLVRAQRVVRGTVVPAPAPARTVARTLADGFVQTEEGGFTPVAASNIARITEDTLNAIAFPTFVADLIKGTFQAIVDASIQQMEAYARAALQRRQDGRPVHGRQHHRQQRPRLARRRLPAVARARHRVGPADGEGPPTAPRNSTNQPDFRRDLNLPEDVEPRRRNGRGGAGARRPPAHRPEPPADCLPRWC